MRQETKIALITAFAWFLFSCGTGGGGGVGWVTILSPTTEESFDTDAGQKTLDLAGEVFISPNGPIVNYYCNCTGFSCIGYPLDQCLRIETPRAAVTLHNDTTGLFSYGSQQPTGSWSGTIGLTLGENLLTVNADDHSGNWGADQITVNVPIPPYLYPPIAGGSTELASSATSVEPKRHTISANSIGDAVAAWNEGVHVYAATYKAGIGWSDPVKISDVLGIIQDGSKSYEHSSAYGYPKAVMDDSGRAIVTWHQMENPLGYFEYINYYKYSSVFDPVAGWSAPVRIGDAVYDSNLGGRDKLVIDDAGNALLFWEVAYRTVVAAHYTPASGWSNPKSVDMTVPLELADMDMTVDSSGIVHVLWKTYFDTGTNMYYATFDWDSGWSDPVILGVGSTYNSGEAGPQIAVSGAGQIVTVWATYDWGKSIYQVVANYFKPGVGWSGQTSIETGDAGDARDVSVGIDSSGNAIAAWRYFNGSTYTARAAEYTAATGWGGDYELAADTVDIKEPAVTRFASGATTAFWLQYDSWRYSIIGKKYTSAGGWEEPKTIEVDKAAESSNLVIANSRDPETFIAWTHVADTEVVSLRARKF